MSQEVVVRKRKYEARPSPTPVNPVRPTHSPMAPPDFNLPAAQTTTVERRRSLLKNPFEDTETPVSTTSVSQYDMFLLQGYL
jgi:hypothetical protein